MIPSIESINKAEVPEHLKRCFTCSRRNSGDSVKPYCETCIRNDKYQDSYKADDMLIQLIKEGAINDGICVR